MKKISDCQTLSYSKTVPVEFEKKFHSVTLGYPRTLCTESAKRTTFKFVHFLVALEDSKKGRKFFKENWYLSKRKKELFEDRVRPRK